MKKRIALIVDTDDWAFANIARAVKSNLSKYFDFTIVPTSYFSDDIVSVLILVKEYDLLHFFWRGKLLSFDYFDFEKRVNSIGMTKEQFLADFFNNKIITTAVYDHLYLDSIDDIEITNKILNHCDNYYVSSQKLYDIYMKEKTIEKKPKLIITDGVDLKKFFPINLNRFLNLNRRKIVIGWVGNSAWEKDKEDFKGVNTILKPAITELQKEGYNLEMYFADKQERMIPHSEMNDYYGKIDLYICVSKMEGTPNPVLEAMACGVPIISTDVGIVPEVFGKLQKKYILKRRTKNELKKMIIYFINNLSDINKIQTESAIRIYDWQWHLISKKFKTFFDNAFKEAFHDKK